MAFDFFQAAELPAPVISVAEAADIARHCFGLTAGCTSLGSQQDANFLLTDGDRTPLGVLKIANQAFTRTEIEAQDAAARFIADRDPRLRTAHNATPAGAPAIAEIATETGGVLFARILRHLGGGTMSGDRYVSPVRWAALGRLAGRASTALAAFDHPGVDRVLQWDLRHADRTIELLTPHVTDRGRQQQIRSAAHAAWDTVAFLSHKLTTQVIHGDITDDNVVCDTAAPQLPDGIIDFGDLTRSWAIAELAVAASSVLRHAGAEPATALPMIVAFARERPLRDAEIGALWPLVVLRAATLVVSGHHQAVIDAHNAYATGALDLEWRIFERATSVPCDVMTGVIKRALGRLPAPARLSAQRRLLAGLDPATIRRLDFSATSDDLDSGCWLERHCEDRQGNAALHAGAVAATTDYAQPRITKAIPRHGQSSATVPTGIDVWVAAPTPLSAPWPGRVTLADDGRITLAGDEATLVIRGACVHPEVSVSCGDTVAVGASLGTAGPGRMWLRAGIPGAHDTPPLVRPEYAPGWLTQTLDPAPLLGLPTADPAADSDAETLVRRRGRTFAPVQEQYYRHPPRIERGWREHLLDVNGRSYLDMINNVAAIGHGHPELAEAIARQWRRLNTNSRFNYQVVVDFSERLAATLPDPLDTVFLVNSGSEAVDLALRLAWATTGRRDVVAVREAYHGWTDATDAISTSVADNPAAPSTRPEWVHTVASPNSFRGEHRGPDAHRYATQAVADIELLVTQGRPPAAFICEPFYGNAGGIALPDGYLSEVYRAVRAAGGLAIADEIQVGYGRLGRWFWGFQGQEVIPDIVTVAKAMGNGQPLGAVVTTRTIAENYRTQGYFFSSAGGSPVSCVAGLRVLDVIEREGLQHNALIVGQHLRTRITEVAERHPLIGAVHGSGLYLGIELIRDPATLEPAVEETLAICERMLELGVIVQPTGDRMNVLKIKPPLCLSIASADFFVDTLSEVLDTGW